jgi:dTDP-4-amino-4,6-dideoxygalactose transaminase
MSEFHAAMALESLEMIDSNLRYRRQLAAHYRRCLDEVPGISYQSVPITDESTFKDFTIRVDESQFGLNRDQLVEVLTGAGIETRNYFDPPLHRHRAFDGEQAADLRGVDEISRSVTSLPIHADLDVATVERIVEVIRLAHQRADEITSRSAPTSSDSRHHPDRERLFGAERHRDRSRPGGNGGLT